MHFSRVTSFATNGAENFVKGRVLMLRQSDFEMITNYIKLREVQRIKNEMTFRQLKLIIIGNNYRNANPILNLNPK